MTTQKSKYPKVGDIIKLWPYGRKFNESANDIVLVLNLDPVHLLPIKKSSGHHPIYYGRKRTHASLNQLYDLIDIETLQ